MTVAAPKLDKRSAADVLAEARRLAREVYLSGGAWEGSEDPKDPASQLLELFARLMEILIGRLNRVPEKNFLAFLDMVGVEASPGAAATPGHPGRHHPDRQERRADLRDPGRHLRHGLKAGGDPQPGPQYGSVRERADPGAASQAGR
jgi:hypothetical protein